jgi:hypothetical protein
MNQVKYSSLANYLIRSTKNVNLSHSFINYMVAIMNWFTLHLVSQMVADIFPIYLLRFSISLTGFWE